MTGTDPRPDLIEIMAVPPPRRWGWIWDLLTLPWTIWHGPAGARASDPTAVIVRYRGRERLLFRVDSFEEAKAKVERVAREYEVMDTADWCERYQVPEDFFADE
jgi:hypothetical protein